ncbi:MAG: PhoH family protein [Planctomycetota bacterium]
MSQKDNAIKTFVLDTSVLLHNPNSLFVFQENNVVIPFAVLEELDEFKSGSNDLARNARQCIRHFDKLRRFGRLDTGVRWTPTSDGVTGAKEGDTSRGVIRIHVQDGDRPDGLQKDSPDNRIITIAYSLMQQGEHAVFVSKDINARIKADALGVDSQDFENQKVDAERLYTGQTTIDALGDHINELYDQRMLPLSSIREALTTSDDEGNSSTYEIETNEFVLLKDSTDESHSGIARRLADTDHLVPVTGPKRPVFGVMARNVEQTMALELLLDDEVKLVTLTGGAGTGKTLLALAAGMTKVFQEERYDKLLVARPIVPMGRDIGYLPGEKEDKLSAWMQPIFDNLDYLMGTRGSHYQNAESLTTEQRLERLLADGKLVLEALTYIRGRSIPHQFIIVDEAQNLTPHEVKTIISRAGEGTKIVLTGDIEQIDNPYLDSSSNGLSYCVDRMRGSGFVGHVTLLKSERSELASLAAEKL